MGQKVHPHSLRLNLVRDWESHWFAKRGYSDYAIEDTEIRRYLFSRFARGDTFGRDRGRDGGIARVEIERAANIIRLTLHTAKPGIIIGRGGRGIDEVRGEIERKTGKAVHINVVEVRVPELEAQLVAESVASQIERRISFKRAVRQAVARSMRAGAKGAKVMCAGRLGGSELSRVDWDKDGRIPLHTLRADIDYGFAEANMTYGHIGIKVWVYRGDVLPAPKVAPPKPAVRPAARPEEGPRVRRVPGLKEIQEAQAREQEAALAEQAESEQVPGPDSSQPAAAAPDEPATGWAGAAGQSETQS